MRLIFPLLMAVFISGCAASYAEPGDLAGEILADLDAGQVASAGNRFKRSARSTRSRETIYPILYEKARAGYEGADVQRAVVILRFLAAHYPRATAAREALLYSLFLERAKQPAAELEVVAEINLLIREIRAVSVSPPVWVDLITAQNEVDRGRLAEGRTALARFKANWNGNPAELVEYVEELERYFLSHSAAGAIKEG